MEWIYIHEITWMYCSTKKNIWDSFIPKSLQYGNMLDTIDEGKPTPTFLKLEPRYSVCPICRMCHAQNFRWRLLSPGPRHYYTISRLVTHATVRRFSQALFIKIFDAVKTKETGTHFPIFFFCAVLLLKNACKHLQAIDFPTFCFLHLWETVASSYEMFQWNWIIHGGAKAPELCFPLLFDQAKAIFSYIGSPWG